MSLVGKSLLFFSLFVLSAVSLFVLLPDGDSDSTETDASSELPVESETPLEAFDAPPKIESDPPLADATIQELTDVLTVEADPIEVSDDPETNTTLAVTVPPTTPKASTTQTTAQKTGATTPATNPDSTSAPAAPATPVAAPASGGGSVGVPNGKPPQVTSKPTPVNSDAYFVTANGNDSNTGRAEGEAFKTIQKGVDTLQPGQTLYVKAGNYPKQTVQATLKGQSGKPITIEGYKNNPGDNPTITGFNHLSSPDPNVMPLLDGVSKKGTGFLISGSHFQIKNFQLSNHRNGLTVAGTDIVVDNVIASDMGVKNEFYNGHGIVFSDVTNSVLSNSVVTNVGAEAISFRRSSNNLIENSAVYSNDDSVKGLVISGKPVKTNSATDYYFILSNSNSNTIRNNYIHRVGNLDHGGHGFTVKATGSGNVFEGNTAINLAGGGFVVRHRGVKNNTFRNNLAREGVCLLARDGAIENLFENNSLENCETAISFMDSVEDNGKFASGIRNSFKDLQIIDAGTVIQFHSYSYADSISSDNTFENITVDGADLLIRGDHYSKNNLVTNSHFKDIGKFLNVSNPRKETDIEIKFKDTQCTNCAFALPS